MATNPANVLEAIATSAEEIKHTIHSPEESQTTAEFALPVLESDELRLTIFSCRFTESPSAAISFYEKLLKRGTAIYNDAVICYILDTCYDVSQIELEFLINNLESDTQLETIAEQCGLLDTFSLEEQSATASQMLANILRAYLGALCVEKGHSSALKVVNQLISGPMTSYCIGFRHLMKSVKSESQQPNGTTANEATQEHEIGAQTINGDRTMEVKTEEADPQNQIHEDEAARDTAAVQVDERSLFQRNLELESTLRKMIGGESLTIYFKESKRKNWQCSVEIFGYGRQVIVFEAGSRDNLGGIWSRVNSTSVSQITKLWEEYNLDLYTKFNTKVTSIRPDESGRWSINDDPSLGKFDGVIAAVGTCGDPKVLKIAGEEKFRGHIYHSSELDGKNVKGKTVLIVGGGASAVEAVQFAVEADAGKIKVLARSEKWIIPRNAVIDMILAFNIFGYETWISWVPEWLLRLLFYRDLADIAPPRGKGVFTETPMVNTDILKQIRAGKAEWLRGDILGFEDNGIRFNHRTKGVPKNGPGRESIEEGEVVIMATGYKRPSLDFLPPECFEEPYMPPNWYLQCFPPQHLSICAENSTYVNGIGAVGNFHIGIYTRILLMFLLDPLTRPSDYWMKVWVNMTRYIKARSPTGAFDFFTYSELMWWFVFCVVINPLRWKWAIFVFFGLGINIPLAIVDREKELRNDLDFPDEKDIQTF
ncbi:hypothetical protein Dda_7278 [Drechslerella dactyloides]|uniref:RNase III domain-containing protein n=1 Tax=Drechslerella dactyloides TaxID=74499 RepID=A0AAD6IRV7_DREDA|nr:hypothetical protein Dda_7278 [Drechslerella dactyloides]